MKILYCGMLMLMQRIRHGTLSFEAVGIKRQLFSIHHYCINTLGTLLLTPYLPWMPCDALTRNIERQNYVIP